jgi:hypothetical protein
MIEPVHHEVDIMQGFIQGVLVFIFIVKIVVYEG